MATKGGARNLLSHGLEPSARVESFPRRLRDSPCGQELKGTLAGNSEEDEMFLDERTGYWDHPAY